MTTQLVTIICVPCHVGISEFRVGLGPRHPLEPVSRELELQKVAVDIKVIPHVDRFEREIGRSWELLSPPSLSKFERACLAGLFPMTLAGNCNTSVVRIRE